MWMLLSLAVLLLICVAFTRRDLATISQQIRYSNELLVGRLDQLIEHINNMNRYVEKLEEREKEAPRKPVRGCI